MIKNLPKINDWFDVDFLKKNKMLNWNEAIEKLHNTDESKRINSKSFRRIVFDEIFANLLVLSENRKRIKIKKIFKDFNNKFSNEIIKKLPFDLTNDQKSLRRN